MLPLLTFAIPTEGQRSGLVWLWVVVHIQIPHVLFVRGPWLQGLEEALVTRRILPCELQPAFHTLNARKQLQRERR